MSEDKLAQAKDLRPLGARAGARWRVSGTQADLTRPPRAMQRIEVAAQPKSLAVDLAKTAMIVVDMQNDFCAKGGWLDHIGVDFTPARKPIAPLARLLPMLRNAGVPVVWVNWGNRPDKLNLSPCLLHVYNGDGRSVGIGDPLPSNGAPVLQKDSWAAAVVDELEIAPDDVRIDKYRMSGFWDTPLDAVLRNLGIATVLFGGVNADQCVLATLMDANFLGYDTILVEDCAATTSPAYCWEATLYNVRVCFGFTVTSDALMKGDRVTVIANAAAAHRVFRIKASDSNKFAVVADPVGSGTSFITVVEIFDVGGRTPPNSHRAADELFYVLHGEGVAVCDGRRTVLRKGDSLLVRAGVEHVVENTGAGRLYCLTTMVPDEAFAALIRSGVPDSLDEQDLAVLSR